MLSLPAAPVASTPHYLAVIMATYAVFHVVLLVKKFQVSLQCVADAGCTNARHHEAPQQPALSHAPLALLARRAKPAQRPHETPAPTGDCVGIESRGNANYASRCRELMFAAPLSHLDAESEGCPPLLWSAPAPPLRVEAALWLLQRCQIAAAPVGQGGQASSGGSKKQALFSKTVETRRPPASTRPLFISC